MIDSNQYLVPGLSVAGHEIRVGAAVLVVLRVVVVVAVAVAGRMGPAVARAQFTPCQVGTGGVVVVVVIGFAFLPAI